MEQTKPILEIKDLSIEYCANKRVVKAVNHLDLCIEKGESVGLVGETGAGKTTTALGVMGLIPNPPGVIRSGEILFEGGDLLKLSAKKMRQIRSKKIAMIFQDPMTSLNPVMTVGDQIAESYRIHDKLSRAEAAVKAKDMLELVGIPAERYGEYPHQFSGGMKQRVVIAIALSCNPELLLADEPTTALDVTIQAQVLDLIVKLKKERNTSMVLITHDLGVVAEVCDTAEMVQMQLAEIGITMKIASMERGTFIDNVISGNLEMFGLGWTADTGDPDYALFASFHSSMHGEGGNMSFYTNPEVDKLLDLGRSSTDPEVRKDAYYKVQEIVWNEVPCVFLQCPEDLYAYNSNLKNFATNADGSIKFAQLSWN